MADTMAQQSDYHLMTSQQKAIEVAWIKMIQHYASDRAYGVSVRLEQDTAQQLGDEGIAELKSRSERFTRRFIDDIRNPSDGSVVLKATDYMMAWGAEVTPEAQAAAAHTPRPANAFILYRAQHHRAMVASHPGTPNTMISKMIGKMWSQESEEVRQDFKRQAEIVKGAHMAKNPDYQYKPRKPAEKKRRMTKRKAARLVALQQVYGDNAGFPATSPLSMASSSPATPADTAALSPFIADSAVPLLEPAGIDSTFLFDSAAPDQIKLFEEMLLNHLSSMEEPGSVDTQPPVISSELTNVGKAQWLNDMVIDGVNAIGGGSQSFATFGNQFKQQTDLGTPDELTAQAMTDEALDSVGNWQMADVFDYALLYGNEAFAAPVGESETK